jgi:beta-phosphoglucomutase-like phosphatase (HAD superfamily)
MEPKLDHGIRAVLFDLDGVLVDAADWHRDAFDMALSYAGYKPLGEEEHENDFNGLSTRKKLLMLVEQERIPCKAATLDIIHKRKQEITMSLINNRCKPIERVKSVVIEAKKLGPIAVVTNCSRPSCELMLELSGIKDMFDLIVTNEDVDGKIKPHPWPYIKAMNHFNMMQRQALAIDDTFKGIMSALEASCRTWRLKEFEDLTVGNLNKILENLKITI